MQSDKRCSQGLFALFCFITCLGIALPFYASAADSATSPQVKYVTETKVGDSLGVDIFLMISSFNPDTKRTMDFINDFSKQLESDYKSDYLILIEDLGVRNFTEEAHEWKGRVSDILNKYSTANIKAIIAIGQEAWAAIFSQDSLPKDIPIFGSYISSNGIVLPDKPIDSSWEPTWINNARRARQKSVCGAIMNVYIPKKNIDLILSFYPNTKNVVLLTDNSYGGQSIKALFKKDIAEMPALNYIFIDSRHHYFEHVKELVRELPDSTAILVGTWRVNRDGLYYLPRSLEEITSERPDIPVFSMTGTGIGSVAIGGYIPIYQTDAKYIVNQIESFYSGHADSVRFKAGGGYYQFDNNKLRELSVRPDQLPANSVLINTTDPRVEKYRNYVRIVSIIALILTIFFVVFVILYHRNRKLRRSLEEKSLELMEAKEKAEESDRLKTAFLANMSHEIRTPLNAIVGFSNLLAGDEFSAEERQSMSKVITQNSELLLTLITDILDISGLETGKMNFLFKHADINHICEQAVSTISHLRKPGIEYKFSPGAESLIIKTDVHRITQVLINLLTNANKFTESGSINLEYKIVKTGSTGQLLFSVTDTGIGIPPEKRDKLFERFGKLNNFKQGAGLGLAISKQIVTKLGGEIWLDKNYTTGSRFFFTHPI